jgi:4-amino-4-deoxy-L-arabinose transferase-like glycosyltransferase
MLVAAGFLASNIALNPLYLWDESRLAVNALEMSQRGFSLITTFGFQPDLWNTKPPLLIWLQAGSIDLFGPSEWAVRLPSLIAALATIALVMRFSWRLGRSRFVALAAPSLLLFSPGWFGVHAAQSGDYETLLCFFTTAYLLVLFEVLHHRRPDPWRVVLCGLLIAGACLTKGIAGLAPGVGAFVYVVIKGRWPRLFKSPWYVVAGLIVLVLVGGFYWLRERAAPGYLAAMADNELGRRYLQGMSGHIQPFWYYGYYLLEFFALGPLVLLLFAAPFLRWKPTRSAAFVTYAGCVALAMLVILTLSRTKIFWYMTPVYPIVSIALAIVVDRLFQMLPRQARPLTPVVVLLAGAFLIGNGLVQKFVVWPPIENGAQGRYGLVFAQLDRQGLRRIRTLDGGVFNNDGLVDYTPQRRFYSLAWRARGLDIAVQDPNQPVALAAGEVLVTCDPSYLAWVAGRGPSLTRVPGCAAVRGPLRGG